MNDTATYIQVLKAHYDPTHTTAIRNAFARNAKRRFTELALVVAEAILKQDCFGLKKESMVIQQMNPPAYRSFAFLRDSEKVEAFMQWLQDQVNKGVLELRQFRQIGQAIEYAWTDMYILDSYKRGIVRARYELKRAGLDVPSVDDSGGIDAVLNGTPFHLDRVGLLFTRVYSDLKGITDAMDAQISRILSQGMIDGDGPALLARKLVAAINGTGAGDLGITDIIGRFIPAKRRAEMLARTEIIRAHHLATIQEYRNWGLEGVRVQAEWSTAGDDRVCERCQPLEGKLFTLDEIEDKIPLHPQCRCIALPHIKELEKYYNK